MKKETAFFIGASIAIGVLRFLNYKREEKEREETRAAMQKAEEVMKNWKPKFNLTVDLPELDKEKIRKEFQEEIKQELKAEGKWLETEEDGYRYFTE